MSGQDVTIFGLKLAFSLAAVILVVVYMVLPVLRSLRSRPEILDSMARFEISPEIEDEELEIPTEQGGVPPRESIIEDARSDPRRAARMVARWLKEKK